MSNKNKPSMAQLFVAFLIAFFGSKAIFHFMDFNYSLFKDPFDLGKLLIDIGVFFGLFFISMMVYNLFNPKRSA